MEEENNEKKEIKIEITELFMAKADWNRCFHGIIKKVEDVDGQILHFSSIKVNEGYIFSRADDRDKLGSMLDDIVIFILDFGLHKTPAASSEIFGERFFHN